MGILTNYGMSQLGNISQQNSSQMEKLYHMQKKQSDKTKKYIELSRNQMNSAIPEV